MIAAVRVRGSVNVSPGHRKTLELLMLDRVNHLVLVNDSQRKMLDKVQSFVTFGELDLKTLALLLERRGRLPGGKKISRDFLKSKGFKGFEELASALAEGKVSLRQLGLKPVFRLGPPKKGFERAGIKKGYSVGGALGYRASDMGLLVRRMA